MKIPFLCLVSKSVSMEATTNNSTNISFAVNEASIVQTLAVDSQDRVGTAEIVGRYDMQQLP